VAEAPFDRRGAVRAAEAFVRQKIVCFFCTFVCASERERAGPGFVPTFGIMSLVVLGVVRHTGGVPAMAAFPNGCAMELRAVCRPMEVRGAAAVMADAEAAHSESATRAVNMDARYEHSGDWHQCARSSP
jgi:hypothetical protein